MREKIVLLTIHDVDLGDVIVEKQGDSLVFLFPKSGGWMYAAPSGIAASDQIKFGYYHNEVAE